MACSAFSTWAATDAYDDSAFEEYSINSQSALEEEFEKAIALLNAKGFSAALKPLKSLAVKGHAKSQYMIGVFYRYGEGVRRSDKRSAQWLKLAADQRYPLAMLAYAEACIDGAGTRQDFALARELLDPVSRPEWDFPVPIESFGMIRSTRARAGYLLAYLLANGQGGETDKVRAVNLLRSSADSGSFESAVFLAMAFASGEIVDRDLAESRRYFDLVRQKASDIVVRSLEGLAIEYLDNAMQEMIQKAANEVNKEINRQLNVMLRRLGEEMLDRSKDVYDPAFAAGLLELAAESGDAGAQAIIGYLYHEGIGVEKSIEKAAVWVRKSAEEGWTLGLYNCAAMALLGEIDSVSEPVARQYLNRSANVGLLIAQLALDGDIEPRLTLDKDDLELARNWKDRDDPRVVYSLAKRSERGWLVDRIGNPSKLLRQYRQSADKGYHRAQALLGEAYANGNYGLPNDDKKAVEFYEKAVAADNVNALFRLGYILQYGRSDIPVDSDRAARLYLRAIDLGDWSSANNLGVMYVEGKGVEQDNARAMELFRIAGENGNEVACYNYGLRYYQGHGVDKDETLGLEWLVKSGEMGYLSAIRELIKIYTPKTDDDGFFEMAYWTEKAAEEGDEHSKKSVAVFYYKGIGVPRNVYKAYTWVSSYLSRFHYGSVKFSDNILSQESREEISAFLPVDYEALLLLVKLHLEEGWSGYDPQQAFEYAKNFAKTRLFEGRLLLAKLHLYHDVKGAKTSSAIKLYESIYKEGKDDLKYRIHAAKAAFELSRLYANESGTVSNAKKRAEWMLRSGELGVASANYYYANFLIDGVGVPVDEDRGIAILIELARKGYLRAAIRLGDYLSVGRLRDQRDLIIGKLRSAAESGNKQAQDMMHSLGEPFDNPTPTRKQDKPEREEGKQTYRGALG